MGPGFESLMVYQVISGAYGGIGRRVGLRSRCPRRGGSSPFGRTKPNTTIPEKTWYAKTSKKGIENCNESLTRALAFVIIAIDAGVTQLVECHLAKVKVAGSSPVSRSIKKEIPKTVSLFLFYLIKAQKHALSFFWLQITYFVLTHIK